MMDSSMTFSNIDYSAYNVSGGYAYNSVFARNFLFDISVQACLAYKRATNEVKSTNLKNFLDFDFRNLKGKTFAFLNSRPIGELMAREGGISVRVYDLEEAINDLAQGKYDAVICYRYQAK